MSETKYIKILHDGRVIECCVVLDKTPPWKLVFSGLGMENREFAGHDLFEALVALRRELEGMDARVLCAGARRDAYPSAMSRNMCGGRKVYVTRLGSPALKSDLVDIFEDAAAELVGSVAEQKDFHKKWFQSLGNPPDVSSANQ